MKPLEISNNEWYYIEKVIDQMKTNTEIRIIITKTGQIHVYKNKSELEF